jgi:hypothetical protein
MMTTNPLQIVDPDNVPPRVAKERPNGKKATWYAVRFFPTGDLYVFPYLRLPFLLIYR